MAVLIGLIIAGTAHAQTVNYAYDSEGRLVSAATVGGLTTTYSYDANGNRTQKVIGTGGGTNPGGGNRAPTAVADSESWGVPISGGPGFPVSRGVMVLANDSDPDGDPLTITGVTTPTNGATASITSIGATQYVLVGNIGMSGTSLSYTISDGRGGTASAAITLSPYGYHPCPVGQICDGGGDN